MKKIKELITLDTRISLFQTAMNNAGRNFNGKKVPVKKMAEFATDFYKVAIKEIGNIGKMEMTYIEKITLPKEKKKNVSFRCEKCKKGRLTKQEHDYSVKVYKKVICRDCQKKKGKKKGKKK